LSSNLPTTSPYSLSPIRATLTAYVILFLLNALIIFGKNFTGIKCNLIWRIKEIVFHRIQNWVRHTCSGFVSEKASGNSTLFCQLHCTHNSSRCNPWNKKYPNSSTINVKKKSSAIKLDAHNIIKMIGHGFQCDEFSLSYYKESIARKLCNRV
jgi:hypothetical protein